MNRTTIALRHWLRTLGITPVLARVMNRVGLFGGAEGYEERFAERMFEELREGDIVWEVGANVGLYTREFCHRVGGAGRVIAFEPTPVCYEKLNANCESEIGQNCETHQLALGASDGEVEMQLADDPLGATHSVLTEEQKLAGAKTIAVEMVRGETLAQDRGMPRPNFLKVDVEGSELDVFQGLGGLLAEEGCRAIFCEVHFGLLAERGQPYASQEIEKLLAESGLSQQEWLDASHLMALRPEAG